MREHIKRGHGCCGGLYDEKAKNKCHKWHKILEEIAQGFEAGDKLSVSLLTPDQEEKLQKKFDRGMDLFKKYFFNLWD